MKQPLLFVLLTLSTLLFSFNIFAQSFRSGFVVQANGDTTQGLIKYREGNSSLKSCLFKINESSAPVKYTPNDILAYGIHNGALYESKHIADEQGKALIAFAEVLVHGKLSLYQHKNLFFLAKERGELHPFLIETDNVDNRGRVGEQRIVTTSTNHIILINSLTYDCTVPEELLAKVLKRVTAPHITAIVEHYNNCIEPNSNVSYKADKPWIAVEKGILVGSHTTTITVNAAPHTVSNANFSMAHNAVFGASFNVTYPRTSEKFSLHLEPLYSQEKHLGYQETTGLSTTERNDYTIHIKRLSAVAMARYSFASTNKISPYFSFGLSNNFILSGKGVARVETETLINDKRYIETAMSGDFVSGKHRRVYINPTAAVGTGYRFTQKHRMQFQLRYESSRFTPGNYIQRQGFTTQINSNNSLYLTATYILK